MRYLGTFIGFFVPCVLFSAMMSSSAQSVRGAQEVEQEARRSEQELREHGFTNAQVNMVPRDAFGVRMHTRLAGPGVSNISVLAELKLPDPCLRLYQTQVSDLSPLTNIPLKELFLDDAPNVSDRSLSALHGARLEALLLNGTSVSDLAPLEGMPLHAFVLISSRVHDLSVLAPMQLNSCCLISNKVSDVSVLKGKPLSWLTLVEPAVTNISALRGAPLRCLDMRGSGVHDLGPLSGVPLEQFFFTLETVTNGIDVIRAMETLKTINGMPAREFWEQYDKGTIE